MGNALIELIDAIIKIGLFGFALSYVANIKNRLSIYLLDEENSILPQFIIFLFTAISFVLYLLTEGIIDYKFAASIAQFIVDTTAYSDPLTEPVVAAVLGLLIFKQLSAVIERFLSDITSKIFLFVYNDIC